MFNVIIPARAGSKRLPGKNMMELCGKPLIHYTISAALEASYVNEILVSTDDPEIGAYILVGLGAVNGGATRSIEVIDLENGTVCSSLVT